MLILSIYRPYKLWPGGVEDDASLVLLVHDMEEDRFCGMLIQPPVWTPCTTPWLLGESGDRMGRLVGLPQQLDFVIWFFSGFCL